MVHRLHRFVIEEYRHRRNVVVVIDEAQNMPIETLESLRVLSNLDSSTDKLIQIVLVGQPELAETLDRLELRQLKQRVAVRCTLTPTRTKKAWPISSTGCARRAPRPRPSSARRAARDPQVGQGIPRKINVVCDNSLVTGLGYRTRPVTAAIVQEAIADLEGKPRATRRWRVKGSVAALLVMGAVLSVLAYRGFIRQVDVEADNLVPSAPPGARRLRNWQCPRLSRSRSASRVDRRVGRDRLPAARRPVAGRHGVVRRGDTLLRLAMDVYGFPLERSSSGSLNATRGFRT